MSGFLDVQAVGADKLLKGLSAAPAATTSELEATMNKSLLLIEGTARQNVKQDTRALMNSINSRVEHSGATLIGRVGPSLKYGLYVERGTRPHWPPRGPLEGWARRHNIPVFLVQRAIARKGTRAAPFLLPAFEKHQRDIISLFEKVGGVVVKVIAGGGR